MQILITKIVSQVDVLIDSLPPARELTRLGRRNIIARYTSVLEGNFIAWMTAALLAARSEQAIAILKENLNEEICDNHPGMLRRFAIAADAVPDCHDYLAVSAGLESVRQFVATTDGVRIMVMMAFFECFISKFMDYLATLAKEQGSAEFVYTNVHGPLDIVHSQQLYVAIEHELGAPGLHELSLETLVLGIPLLSRLVADIIGHEVARPRVQVV